jgi:hypothetical protein
MHAVAGRLTPQCETSPAQAIRSALAGHLALETQAAVFGAGAAATIPENLRLTPRGDPRATSQGAGVHADVRYARDRPGVTNRLARLFCACCDRSPCFSASSVLEDSSAPSRLSFPADTVTPSDTVEGRRPQARCSAGQPTTTLSIRLKSPRRARCFHIRSFTERIPISFQSQRVEILTLLIQSSCVSRRS